MLDLINPIVGLCGIETAKTCCRLSKAYLNRLNSAYWMRELSKTATLPGQMALLKQHKPQGVATAVYYFWLVKNADMPDDKLCNHYIFGTLKTPMLIYKYSCFDPVWDEMKFIESNRYIKQAYTLKKECRSIMLLMTVCRHEFDIAEWMIDLEKGQILNNEHVRTPDKFGIYYSHYIQGVFIELFRSCADRGFFWGCKLTNDSDTIDWLMHIYGKYEHLINKATIDEEFLMDIMSKQYDDRIMFLANKLFYMSHTIDGIARTVCVEWDINDFRRKCELRKNKKSITTVINAFIAAIASLSGSIQKMISFE